MWQFVVAGAQIAGGLMGRSAAKKQGKIAKRVALLNAELIELETETNIRRIRQQARKLVGTQAALYAKGGVRAREGSAYEVALETQIMAEQDVALVELEGKIRSSVTRMGGQAAQTGYNYAATGALIQGIAGGIASYNSGS